MATAETARDALSEYMHVLLKVDAFWYSIDSNHSHGFPLYSRFGMSQQDFEALLLAATIAKYSDKFGFRSNKKEWSSFINSYRFWLDSLRQLPQSRHLKPSKQIKSTLILILKPKRALPSASNQPLQSYWCILDANPITHPYMYANGGWRKIPYTQPGV